MIIPVFFFLLCAKFTESFVFDLESSLYEGDDCSMTNGDSGVCTFLTDCYTVYEDLKAGILPDTTCGYVGFDPIICCPTNTRTTTSPMTTTTSTTTPATTTTGRGAIARQKCAEYAKAVSQDIKDRSRTIITLIVGGTKAKREEFPHMAAVGFNVANSRISWDCGGTLISDTFVLTAAHCTFNRLLKGNATWVRLGVLNLIQSVAEDAAVDRRITERIRHPQYKFPSQYHDIALLRLESQVPFNDWIRPACLYTALSMGNTTKATATGWGRIDFEAEMNQRNLLKVNVPFVNQSSCNASYSSNGVTSKMPTGIVDEWMICAGEKGKDTCQGDSGGPLVLFHKPESYMFDVIGVICGGQFCGASTPAFYARVYYYVPWIESVVWGV